MIKKGFIFLVIFLSFIQTTLAEDPSQIIVNSEDWKDVYSTVLYGNLIGKSTSFLVSDKHSTLILNSLPKDNHLWVFSSAERPYIIGYSSIIESRGFSVEEFEYDNINLELATQLDVNNFIIVDDSYGYNAIAVAPYAVATDSYVFFVDKNNINRIDAFLEERELGDILIYGHVDREVKEALAKYDPEIINKEGDRFENNIEIVKRFQEIKHSKQTVLTNGEFIEKEIMGGTEPVLFIGTNNVPDSIREYIKDSEIEVGVLIGNELVNTATFIRRQIGISVFVKFAQGARATKGAISQVEALDMFYLPTYSLNIEVDSIKYNKATNRIEVTIRNTEDQAVYFKGTYAITASDGTKQTVGDIDAIFIDGNDLKTIIYDIDTLDDEDIIIDIFVIYGETTGSMEKVIDTRITADVVRVLDNCKININEVSYNKRKDQFSISVENIGEVKCYVDLEIIDILLAGEKNTFGLKNVAELDAGKRDSLFVDAELLDEDIPDNIKVKLRTYYGERENNLVNILENVYELTIKGVDYLFYTLLVVIVALIALIYKRRMNNKD